MYSGGMITTPNPFTSPPPTFSIHENKDDDIHIHYYQQDLTRAAVLTSPPALDNYNSLYNFVNQINSDVSTMSSVPPKKTKPAHNFRKDRHSKIVTAQGPRDRRVRLSIQVARKFFDLHDTLGSDKPSETLDWLLTKSQPAIDDLVKNKHSSCTTVDEGCSRSDSTEAAEMGDKQYYMKSKSMVLSDSINITEDQRVLMHHEEKARISSLLARESRARARARARERTRQKMSIRHLFEPKKFLPAHDYRIPANHISTWNELRYYNKSMAPCFNVGADQIGQSTILEFFPETNFQTGVRLCETYNKKFSTQHNN